MSDYNDNDGGFDDEMNDYDDEVDILDEDMQDESDVEDGADGGAVSRNKRKVADSDRITSKFMTKYERARILGTRAL